MKKKLLPIILLFFGAISYSQVGIGTSIPDISAALDIQFNNRGVLIPKVLLKNIHDTEVIYGGKPKEGLLIFNINDENLSQGFYYWGKEGIKPSQWLKITTMNDIENLNWATNESLEVVDEKLVLKDNKGKEVSIDLIQLQKEDIVTSISSKGNGIYIYVNEENDSYVIDVVSDVQTNFETILGDKEVQQILNTYISTNPPKGSVSYVQEGDTYEFKYIDENDNSVSIPMSAIVKEHETKTLLIVKGLGKYEYRNEEQIKNNTAGVQIDVVSDVQTNFEIILADKEVQQILNTYISTNSPKGSVSYVQEGDTYEFKYIDENDNLISIPMSAIVKKHETTTLLIAKGLGKYEYRNEEQIKNNTAGVQIDVVSDVQTNFETILADKEVQQILNTYISTNPPKGSVSYVQEGDTYEFKYIDENNNLVSIPMSAIVKEHETTTLLIAKGLGKYEYRNEEQIKNNTAGVQIDVVSDVQTNFEIILADKEVQQILNTYISTNPPKGSVSYVQEGDTYEFKYIDENDNLVSIPMNAIVKEHETTTWIEYNVETVIEETPEGEVEKKEHTLKYHGENKDDPRNQVIKISELIKGSETVTKLDYDIEKGTLNYANELNEIDVIPLSSLIKRYESKTNLRVDQDNKVLVYKSEDGEEKISLTSLVQEPWFISGTTQGATHNTQDIYTKGWVGIGYDKPSNAPNEKLRVNGSITATNSYYADYVFEKYFDGYSNLKYDYNFNNLKTVENFIKENRHLPGITPITELRKEESGYSFNVSELSIQLLEKTEELYLHTIEQEKKIISLEGELQEVNEKLNKNQGEMDGLKERLQLMEQLILNQSKK
ncbi:MAG: hypothetical protein LBI72_03070 [Flavobacteriaceae bacterium]|jgi:hypothetical protein|nr:hypothetical protein [Flavobacteriaceae bacterium]